MERLPVLRKEGGCPAVTEGRRIPRPGRLFPRVRLDIPSSYTAGELWRRYGRVLALGIGLVAGLAICLWALGVGSGVGGGGENTPLHGGVPPLRGDGTGEVTRGEEVSAPHGTADGEDTVASPESGGESSDTYGESGADTESGAEVTADGESRVPEDTESDVGTDGDPDTSTVTGGDDDIPAETDGDGDIPGETDGDGDTPAETDRESGTTGVGEDSASDGRETEPPAPSETVPEGSIPVRPMDLSMGERGAGYVLRTGGKLPAALPAFPLTGMVQTPAVLVVNTHPYEGYGNGAEWYDPMAGSPAVTDSPNQPEGVVALGSLLAERLRGQGITVIHLRVTVSAEDTADEIYDRVEVAVAERLRLYPFIGLVLDLRRGAEMTEDGGILRTAGTYGGETCAQLRLTVSGGRSEEAVSRDLATALYLRRALWGCSPSVSRPVRVKGGAGLLGYEDGARFLTVELGTAGNTFGEAAALVPLLGDALAEMLSNPQNYG